MLLTDKPKNRLGTSGELEPTASLQVLQPSDLSNFTLTKFKSASSGTGATLSSAAVDPNGTISTADNAGTLTTTINRTGQIGANEAYGRDKHDYWKFSVSSDNKVNLSLSNLSSNAGLALYNGSGKLLTFSNSSGAASESISHWLGKGDYYALAYSYDGWGGNTNYKLSIQAGTQLSNLISDYSVRGAVSSSIKDGILDRNDMINIFRSSKDFSRVDSYEVKDFRNLVSQASTFGMADHVRVLSNKLANGNVANTRSGIGNLFAGSSATQMENLVGKWFFGNNRPTAQSTDGKTTYTYRYTQGSLFQNGISHNDVEQGAIGDCYFMASLGATAHKKSNYIQNMFIDNGDNTYTVRFFKNGVADYVTVDRYLPTNSAGNLVYASSGRSYNSSSNELWAALAEKASAQVNEEGWIGQDNKNSYQGIA